MPSIALSNAASETCRQTSDSRILCEMNCARGVDRGNTKRLRSCQDGRECRSHNNDAVGGRGDAQVSGERDVRWIYVVVAETRQEQE